MSGLQHDTEPFSLSVIIPNRNDARYLPRCIRSVIQQETQPDEVIILDDQSSDDSIEVIQRNISGVTFARLVINPKNLGATENSNRGLELARSKHVFFLGANDFVLPGHFSRMKTCLGRYPHAGLWSAMVWLVDEQDRFIRMHPSPVVSLRDAFFPPARCRHMVEVLGNWLTGQTTVYRRDALVEAGGFDPKLKALTDLMAAHVIASRYGAAFSPAPLGVMRIHKGAFLPETMKDSELLERILQDVAVRGPRVEPNLFTNQTLIKTRKRLYFASLRLSEGATLAHIRARSGRVRGIMLALTSPLSSYFPRLCVIAYFAVMRPFDVLPAIWYRVLGAGAVLVREILAGRAPPKLPDAVAVDQAPHGT